MKKVLLVICFVMMVLMLSACATNPDDVTLATEQDILRCAKNTYGEATILDSQAGKNSVTYIMQDNAYKFQYELKTYAMPVGVDSTWGYKEGKASTFTRRYLDCFHSTCDEALAALETETGVEIAFPYDTMDTACVRSDTLENAISAAEQFDQIVTQFDTRKYWKDRSISLYVTGEYAGSYVDGEFIDADTERANYFMERAAAEMVVSVKALTYTHQETVDRRDCVGLESARPVEILGTDNASSSLVTKYYFSYAGEEYFITDVMIEQDGKLVHFGTHLK